KVGTLMIYPCIVLALSVLVTGFMVMFIVPRIGNALESSGTELNWFTRGTMILGNFLQANFLWVALTAALLAACIFGVRRQIAAAAARLARVVPVLRDVVMTQESAR